MSLRLALLLTVFSLPAFATEVRVSKVSANGQRVLLEFRPSEEITIGDEVTFYERETVLGKAKLLKAKNDKSVWELAGWLAIPGKLQRVRLVRSKSAARSIASVPERRSRSFEKPWGERFPRNENSFEKAW